MAKRITVILAAYAIAAIAIAAQQATPVVASNANSPTSVAVSKAIAKISGRVIDDGKTFVDTEGVTRSITNSDAVAENVGEHVVLRGRIDAGKHEIEVNSVRVDNSAAARSRDVAFRK